MKDMTAKEKLVWALRPLLGAPRLSVTLLLASAVTIYLFQIVGWLGMQAGIEQTWFTELGRGLIALSPVAALALLYELARH